MHHVPLCPRTRARAARWLIPLTAMVSLLPSAAAQVHCAADGQVLSPCVAEFGACVVTGQLTCRADGATDCVADDPRGPELADFVDNDCDGWVDEANILRSTHGLAIMDQCEVWLGWANRNEVLGRPEAEFTRDGVQCGPASGEGIQNRNLACVRSADSSGLFSGLRSFPIRTGECLANTFGENVTFGIALRCPRSDAPVDGEWARYIANNCWAEMAIVDDLPYPHAEGLGDAELLGKLRAAHDACRTGLRRDELGAGDGCVWTRGADEIPDSDFHPLPLGDNNTSFDGNEALAVRLQCDPNAVDRAARGDAGAWSPTTMPPLRRFASLRMSFSAPNFRFDRGNNGIRALGDCGGCEDDAGDWANGRACARSGFDRLDGWGVIDFRKLEDCAEERRFASFGDRDDVGGCGGAGDGEQNRCTSDDRDRWTNRCGMLDERSRFGIGLSPFGAGCDPALPERASCR